MKGWTKRRAFECVQLFWVDGLGYWSRGVSHGLDPLLCRAPKRTPIALHFWLKTLSKVGLGRNFIFGVSLVGQTVKNLPAVRETWVQSLGQEDPLEKGMATHSSILAWRIPWTEEPGELASMGSQESDTAYRLNHHHHHSYSETQDMHLRYGTLGRRMSKWRKSPPIISKDLHFLFSNAASSHGKIVQWSQCCGFKSLPELIFYS